MLFKTSATFYHFTVLKNKSYEVETGSKLVLTKHEHHKLNNTEELLTRFPGLLVCSDTSQSYGSKTFSWERYRDTAAIWNHPVLNTED